jgi:inward rectifier potassium channel
MQNPSFDPGLTQQFTAPLSRVINKDGSFNVRRRGGAWNDVHPYLHLINMSWMQFLSTLFLTYLVVNTAFACVYFALGPDALQGGEVSTAAERFLRDFFFSAHTLSTVGYGSISPKGTGGNIVASLESMVGVLAFAVATGLLYGRVSRPSARFGFSRTMVVAPYQDGHSLQFRVVNRRKNSLTELEVQVLLMTVQMENGQPKRRYEPLKLERRGILFLALTWTVVHPVDSESPLWDKTAEDLERLQTEVLIMMKAYDDTFSQTVAARHSYRHDEIVWGKRFAPAFHVDPTGVLVLEPRKVGEVA